MVALPTLLLSHRYTHHYSTQYLISYQASLLHLSSQLLAMPRLLLAIPSPTPSQYKRTALPVSPDSSPTLLPLRTLLQLKVMQEIVLATCYSSECTNT